MLHQNKLTRNICNTVQYTDATVKRVSFQTFSYSQIFFQCKKKRFQFYYNRTVQFERKLALIQVLTKENDSEIHARNVRIILRHLTIWICVLEDSLVLDLHAVHKSRKKIRLIEGNQNVVT
jgi:hypothetical protein